MKLSIVLLLILICFFGFADEGDSFLFCSDYESLTISEIRKLTHIETAGLEKIFGIKVNPVNINSVRIKEYGLSNSEVDKKLNRYFSTVTIRSLAADCGYPPKKMIYYQDIDVGKTEYSRTLASFNKTPADIKEGLDRYKASERDFMWAIVLLGMIIVFLSLIITGTLISLLEHLQHLKRPGRKKKKIKTAAGIVSTFDGEINEATVAAIITAVYLHEVTIEEENRLLLTWKRASASVWKASSPMPNNLFFRAKRG